MKTLFSDFPQVASSDIMRDTIFWAWIERTRNKNNSIFTDNLFSYLSEYGYNRSLHILSPEQVRIHKTIFDHYYWLKYHKI